MIRQNKIIGREKEIAVLHRCFDSTIGGKGSIVLLTGEAGMGKTSLAEATLADSGMIVFSGRALEAGTPPYGPIASALRKALRQLPKQMTEHKRVSPYLDLLIPEGFPLQNEKSNPTTNISHELLTGAIITACIILANQHPCVLFLDDLQWADDATLELLPLLTERLSNECFLILGTYRSDEIPRGHRIRWLRNELRRQQTLREIALQPLDYLGAALLMEQTLGEKPNAVLAKTIYQQTLGLPFFITELSHALLEQGLTRQEKNGIRLIPGKNVPIPESIRDAVLLRLDGLSDEARTQLEIAAVAGMDFDVSLLADLSGEDVGIDALFERNFIIEKSGGRGAFRHALVREAVRSEIPWSRRRSLNRNIASYLASSGGQPELIAEHWLAANDLEKARHYLLISAKRSANLYAYRDATKAMQRALEIWPEENEEMIRLNALTQLAQWAQMSGQLSEAVHALRELTGNLFIKADSPRLAKALRSLAAIYNLQGAWEQSLRARVEAAEHFEKAGLKSEAATEWLAAARRNYGMMNQANAIRLCEKALALAEKAGDWDRQARGLALKGDVLTSMGNSEIGIETVQSALSLALQHNLTNAAAEVYRRLGSALEYASQFTASREAYFTAYNYCQTQGVDDQAQICLSCMTYVLFRTGDWKQCVKICREIINDPNAMPGPMAIALGVLGIISVYRGEVRSARKNIQRAFDQARQEKAAAKELLCTWGLAEVEASENAPEKAATHYRRVLTLRETLDDTHDSLPILCTAAIFFTDHRCKKEMAMCVKAASEMAAATGNNEALGTLGYVLGENALLQEKPAEAAEQFLQAISYFKKVEIPMELVRAEYRAGIASVRAGLSAQAITHFKNAYPLARNLGCRPLAAQIRTELDTLGENAEERRNAEAPERASQGGLTGRQVEIARLIGDGLTNKEIAAKLFISPRTVEMHVANLLNRLDCRSRSEAVRKASELGLLD